MAGLSDPVGRPGPIGRLVRVCAPALVAGAGYLAAVAVAMAAWSIVEAERSAAAMARLGEATARNTAFLAAEPLLRQDRIRLSLLARRIVEHPEVQRVAIHTVGGRPFVVVGAGAPRHAARYVAPVTVENAEVGEVRVTLSPDSFGLPAQQLFAATWFYWLAGFVLVAGGCQSVALFATRRRRGSAIEDVAEQETLAASQPTNDTTTYLLVVNLFQRADTLPEQRQDILQQGLAVAEQVAAGLDGVAADLPGTGLLLTFDGSDQDDRAFEVVCAALDLRQQLAEQSPDAAPPSFRYCLDCLDATAALSADPDALAAEQPMPVALPASLASLAALARDGEIIVCERAYAALAAPERLLLDDFNHPAAALTSAATPKGIVRGLANVGD